MSENLPEQHPDPQAEHVTGDSPDELHPDPAQAGNPTPDAGSAETADAGTSQAAPGGATAEPVPTSPPSPQPSATQDGLAPGGQPGADGTGPEAESQPIRADEPVVLQPVEQNIQLGDQANAQDTVSAVPEAQDPQVGGVGAEQPDVPDTEPVSPPVTMAEATSGGQAELSSVTVHQGVLVRLADVFAHVENWFARNPQVSRELGADLKSGLGTLERLNNVGGAAPVGDTAEQASSSGE